MTSFAQALLATFGISLISLMGGLFFIRHGQPKKTSLLQLISFAAGVMLSVSFLDLLPEALEASHSVTAFQAALAGIVIFFVLEKLIHQIHCHHPGRHTQTTSIMVLIGDGLHNFFDGVAIAAAFAISPITGIIATVAIAAHEIPQEIADFSVLIHSGLKSKQALAANFMSALTALLGVAVGSFALIQTQALQPALLSLTAGMFIYIALADLIPELEHQHDRRPIFQIAPFLIGLCLTGLLIKTTHSYIDADHGHEDSEAHQELDAHEVATDDQAFIEETHDETDQHEENLDPAEEAAIPEPHF